ncbi:MAG TPA: M23 family metallopeptidase [Gaiellaceae bacterium]|nr:M23 family metallopeptidase [Gaiellaceae bacterium]
MRNVLRAASLAAVLALVLVVGATAQRSAGSSGATATAWAVKVIIPGESGAGSHVATAPPDAVAFGGSFSYPADGSIVKAVSTTTSVSASGGTEASAAATAQITNLSLFGGEITVGSLTGDSHALAHPTFAGGNNGTSSVKKLVILGSPVSVTPNQEIPLDFWGTATALEETGERTSSGSPGFHGFTIALDIVLTAEHGGLPAGAELQLGYAETTAQSTKPTVITTTTTSVPSTPTPTTPTPPPPTTNPVTPVLPVSKPPTVTPPLGESGYVFPVYGQTAWGDTFGSSRPDVSGGWHHGDDIFAPLGTPLLAIAHGTVFSVGFERLGGWRLWLRDDAGNLFYYAHLSAYTPLAVDGAIVNAGDVLGFVGNSGDAEGAPYHLHFEIHPIGLLNLGYDGAVDPSSYLRSWRHVVSAHLVAGAGWVPPLASGAAPKAGAILLQGTDISSASGLDPASLRRIVGSPSVVGR